MTTSFRPIGLSQGPEGGQGPLGLTHRFGQFWMVSVSDPPRQGPGRSRSPPWRAAPG